MPPDTKNTQATYLRNFIFGVEDSLVSTVGLVSGVAVAGVHRSTLLMTGMILIVVEALSMGIGSLLAESSADELVFRRGKSVRTPLIGAVIMFVSYFIAGFVPLLPHILLPAHYALPTSIIASLIALFLLGYVSARMFRVHPARSAIRMFLLGGLAILAGTAVGMMFNT